MHDRFSANACGECPENVSASVRAARGRAREHAAPLAGHLANESACDAHREHVNVYAPCAHVCAYAGVAP